MAHHKRKRPRTAAAGHYSNNALRYRIGEKAYERVKWTRNYPRWWDKCFHTRPRRARERALLRAAMTGADVDAMTWPDGRKPHIYYW